MLYPRCLGQIFVEVRPKMAVHIELSELRLFAIPRDVMANNHFPHGHAQIFESNVWHS
ncbi:hypothetical protein FEP54_00662 [Burkholderia multivorans]|nr:hypothetical protein [Burkholderia multivorans]MDR8921965.1 hypothetical protein [Burkholderia multivorans]MDR8967800.1 hypothetical protein [Burkholderia multivorans]MDR8993249.1 hypothetical protein [Burkholderia multivorans]MDR9019622.1 hypothetical protein [Burkholderia multivorans]